MALKQKIKRGDWIKATNTRSRGPSFVGQAVHDMNLVGSAVLEVVLGEAPSESIRINVNFWDVEIVHENLLTDD